MPETNDTNPSIESASAGSACQTTGSAFAYALTASCLGAIAAVTFAAILLGFAALQNLPTEQGARLLGDELKQELRDHGFGQGDGTGSGDGRDGTRGYSFDYGYNDQGGDTGQGWDDGMGAWGQGGARG